MPWLSSGLDPAPHKRQTELIQKAMLECLDGEASQLARAVMRKIYLAGDAVHLWHLRDEVMTALAFSQGEALARRKVASINRLFCDVLPRTPASKLFGVLHQPIQRGDPE